MDLINVGIRANTFRLYNGRRSFYLCLQLGRRWVFLSRWDTVRVQLRAGQVDLWRGPVMTWYAGLSQPYPSKATTKEVA